MIVVIYGLSSVQMNFLEVNGWEMNFSGLINLKNFSGLINLKNFSGLINLKNFSGLINLKNLGVSWWMG
jgi:hypothetical protein